jgi:hypothetical protein
MYQSGSSVLGVPFYVAVVGTPDNIANLDGPQRRSLLARVIDGTTSQADAVPPGHRQTAGSPAHRTATSLREARPL